MSDRPPQQSELFEVANILNKPVADATFQLPTEREKLAASLNI
jgi:hypothetical protein